MCSRKCARPVLPTSSSRPPTRKRIYAEKIGASPRGRRRNFMPFLSRSSCTDWAQAGRGWVSLENERKGKKRESNVSIGMAIFQRLLRNSPIIDPQFSSGRPKARALSSGKLLPPKEGLKQSSEPLENS